MSLLVLLYYSIAALAQPDCKPYTIQGNIDFNCRQIKKKDLRMQIRVSITDVMNVTREIEPFFLQDGNELSFKKLIARRTTDSYITIHGISNYATKIHCIPFKDDASMFTCNSGLYKGDRNKIILFTCDSADASVFLREQGQRYLLSNPAKAVGYYSSLMSKAPASNDRRRFYDLYEYGTALNSTGHYSEAQNIHNQLLEELPVDSLPPRYQELFWNQYYSNQCLVLGLNANSTKDKVAFNKHFPSIVLSDSDKLATWETFVKGFSSSKFAADKDVKISISFDNASNIKEQKKVVSEALGRKEKF